MGTLPLPEIVFLWLSIWLITHLLPSVILLLIVPNLSSIFLSLALSAYCISLPDIPYVLLTFYCFFCPLECHFIQKVDVFSTIKCSSLWTVDAFLLLKCPSIWIVDGPVPLSCYSMLLVDFFYYVGNSIVLLLRKEPPYLVYY